MAHTIHNGQYLPRFLNLDCIGFLQALNASIIISFKTHDQKYHVRHITEKINKDYPSLIILHDAVRKIKKKAWDEISSENNS